MLLQMEIKFTMDSFATDFIDCEVTMPEAERQLDSTIESDYVALR